MDWQYDSGISVPITSKTSERVLQPRVEIKDDPLYEHFYLYLTGVIFIIYIVLVFIYYAIYRCKGTKQPLRKSLINSLIFLGSIVLVIGIFIYLSSLGF